jgi:hypothetical protein
MSEDNKVSALAEIHDFIRKRKKLLRLILAPLFVTITVIVMLLDQPFANVFAQFLIIMNLIVIFALVFSGRVAIGFARKHFGSRTPHKSLLEFTDAEDLGRELPDVLVDIRRRRFEKYGI